VAPVVPKDYVIGIEDILSVVFWRDKDMSAEVVVRPDGKISLPMLNDVPAAGMTPEQLADSVQRAATKFVRDAGATVIVKAIHSRKVYVIGEVAAGNHSRLAAHERKQIIAEAGGFRTQKKDDDDRPDRRRSGTSIQIQLRRSGPRNAPSRIST
jgi:polysaccharide export outer membrane protein